MYYTSNVTFDNLLILNNVAADDRNDVATIGMNLATYNNLHLVVQNSRIEGNRIGIAAPTSDSSLPGDPQPTIVRNTTLKNYINAYVEPVPDNRPNNGNSLELRDDLFTIVPTIPTVPLPLSKVDPPANIQMRLATSSSSNPYFQLDLTQPSTVKVYNFNQVAGYNFEVFYREQAANFVMPQTTSAALSSSDGVTRSDRRRRA